MVDVPEVRRYTQRLATFRHRKTSSSAPRAHAGIHDRRTSMKYCYDCLLHRQYENGTIEWFYEYDGSWRASQGLRGPRWAQWRDFDDLMDASEDYPALIELIVLALV